MNLVTVILLRVCLSVGVSYFSYMSGCVEYLMSCLRKERERTVAFKAVGQMVLVLKDRMELAPIIQIVKNNLPQNRETLAKLVHYV